MKPIAALAALAALVTADFASAAGVKPVHHRPSAHAAAVQSHRAIRTSHRRRARQHMPVTTASQAQNRAGERAYRLAEDDQSLPTRPGFFRSERDRQAGWGVKTSGAQAVVGVYQRPERPDIPPPQTIDHEGRGAAGLSLSFKLGQ